jgi:preprotein translocase subunit SecE
MARKRRTDNDDADPRQPVPDDAGTTQRRSPRPRSSGTARARPGPQAKTAKAGSVTKAVQQGRFSRFTQEVIAELKKVSWPTRPQLIQATVVVIAAVAIVAVFLGVADWASEWITERIFD